MATWKNLQDNRYEVSDNGDIRNKKTGRILKQSPNKHGYSRVSLSNGAGNIPTIIFPHREVAKAFIPNPDNKPEVNHKNTNKMDPRKDNLEWVTSKENTNHAIQNGLYDPKIVATNAGKASALVSSKVTKVTRVETGEQFIFNSRKECSKELNIPYTTLNTYIKNNKPINGFIAV